MDQFTKEGRKLRPRKSAGAAQSERVEYHPGERRNNYGERRSFGEGRSSNYGENRGSGNYGERRPRQNGGYNRSGAGNGNYGERRSYGEGRSFGERRSFNSENGEQRSSYGESRQGGFSRPRQGPGRPGFGNRNQRPSNGRNAGGRNSFGGNKRQGGARRPGGQAPVFGKVSNEGIERMISRRPVVNGNEAVEATFEVPMSNEIRLNKFIANSGVCSRREADTLIQAGVVTVNGEVVTELGTKDNIFEDDIRFNGERLKGEEKVYIVMNKPKGFVTTSSDPHAEKTVVDLIKGCTARVYPVGRLDKNTTGVLMLTNDGEIAERLTHPSYDKKKIYQVALDRALSQEDYDSILAGITLTDGEVKADELEFIDENDHRKLGIEIHSGKNRIVRRIFESLGYTVKALDRVYFAGLTKKGLKKGEWR